MFKIRKNLHGFSLENSYRNILYHEYAGTPIFVMLYVVPQLVDWMPDQDLGHCISVSGFCCGTPYGNSIRFKEEW